MKRTGPLKRRTPLKARTGLGWGDRPMRQVSKRRRSLNAERRKLAADLPDAPCRLRTPVCTGWAEHFHELVGAGVGGSVTDPRNLVPACDTCNGWIEDRPDRYQMGWKVPAWWAVDGDRGLVPEQLSPLCLAADDEEGAA